MELTERLKTLLIETAQDLKGTVRRVFMAKAVFALGRGGQVTAERELGWNRHTVRKGEHERRTGIACINAFALMDAYIQERFEKKEIIYFKVRNGLLSRKEMEVGGNKGFSRDAMVLAT